MGADLAAGDPAPDFDLPGTAGGRTSLGQLLEGRAGVVVYFFPKAFTAGCTTEVADFAAAGEGLTGAGIAVVGISRDEPDRLAEFSREHGAGALLLSDPDCVAHAAYGVLASREVDGAVVEKVRRSTFLVRPDRTLERVWYDVPADGHVSEVVGAASGA